MDRIIPSPFINEPCPFYKPTLTLTRVPSVAATNNNHPYKSSPCLRRKRLNTRRSSRSRRKSLSRSSRRNNLSRSSRRRNNLSRNSRSRSSLSRSSSSSSLSGSNLSLNRNSSSSAVAKTGKLLSFSLSVISPWLTSFFSPYKSRTHIQHAPRPWPQNHFEESSSFRDRP